MAAIYITEYARQGKDNRGQAISAGEEPALAVQKIAIGGASAQSAALNTKTRFVRIHVDAICSIAFGSNPTATANDQRLAANATEFFGVEERAVEAGLKIANITNT